MRVGSLDAIMIGNGKLKRYGSDQMIQLRFCGCSAFQGAIDLVDAEFYSCASFPKCEWGEEVVKKAKQNYLIIKKMGIASSEQLDFALWRWKRWVE
jgi:hypothetical protein